MSSKTHMNMNPIVVEMKMKVKNTLAYNIVKHSSEKGSPSITYVETTY